MNMQLTRHPQSPPVPEPAVSMGDERFLNAVTQHNGLFHMHYRAQGVDFISRVGYAVSADGLRWNLACRTLRRRRTATARITGASKTMRTAAWTARST
ncbi:MAG: hypothetical protein U0521_01820 [Anaerolineae bacterium]